jgi:hypothetical protein
MYGKTRRGPFAHRASAVTRLLVAGAAVAGAWSFTPVIGPSNAFASVKAGAANDYGSFKVSGPVSGTLVPLASSCDASTSAADVEFGWYGNVKTLKGVSAQSIVSMELDLQGSKYGRQGALENTGGSPPFLTFNATTGDFPLAWQSVSGSYSTAERGVGGTVDVVLDQSNGKPGRVVIRGSWAHCRLGGNI